LPRYLLHPVSTLSLVQSQKLVPHINNHGSATGWLTLNQGGSIQQFVPIHCDVACEESLYECMNIQ